MTLSLEQKKKVLKLAIELMPKQYLMCSAISHAAFQLGLTKESSIAFRLIPELLDYKPMITSTAHVWFSTDQEGYDKRIDILTEILNKL